MTAKRNGLKYKEGEALKDAQDHIAIESMSLESFLEGFGAEIGKPLQEQDGRFAAVYLRLM